jgi:phenylalanyl-tRNA synthetase beta chain
MKTTHSTLQSMIQGKLPNPADLAELIDAHNFEVEEIFTLPDGDTQYDIAVLPDRAADCLCSIGIAREVAALLKLDLKPLPDAGRYRESDPSQAIQVTIVGDSARRYSARRVSLPKPLGEFTKSIPTNPAELGSRSANADKQASDSSGLLLTNSSLAEIVESYGQRSINAVVDASNITMFYWGQPTHAFDADLVVGGISVRPCGIATDFLALDGNTYQLLPDDIVIADDEKILSIAGVKGGASCAVTDKTQNLILEVANFYPKLVRKTARRLNLITDAAKRFENNFSEVDSERWMDYFTGLLVSHLDAQVIATTHAWSGECTPNTQMISVPRNLYTQIMGREFTDSEITEILERRGFSITEKGESVWSIAVPHFRRDMDCPEAVVDEVARQYGYPLGSTGWSVATNTPRESVTMAGLMKYVSLSLIEKGFNESITYSFVESGDVYVAGSVASDKSALRNNLHGLFDQSLAKNYHNRDVLGMVSVRQFEIGAVFMNAGEDVRVIVGIQSAKQKGVRDELFQIISDMLYECGLTEIAIRESIVHHSDTTLELSLTQALSGCTHIPTIQSESGFTAGAPFRVWSPYPSIARDISVWVPDTTITSDLETIYTNLGGDLLVRVFLLDQFSRDGRTSYAHRLVFQSQERTLSDDDVVPAVQSITEKLAANGWEVR